MKLALNLQKLIISDFLKLEINNKRNLINMKYDH